jgi:hypothetical protein
MLDNCPREETVSKLANLIAENPGAAEGLLDFLDDVCTCRKVNYNL